MLDELRHFLLVIEHGTLTAAARHAHLSQPALTASLQRLERDMGARLLHRGPGGAAATAGGLALAPWARGALAAVADGRRAVAEVMGLRAGEVRIGAGATACTYLLPPLLAAFRERHPDVRFLLREARTDEVLDALEAGELDLGIVTGAQGERWRDDELVLIAAPGAAPVPSAAASSALAGVRFVTFSRGSPTRDVLDMYFPEASVVMELGSIAAVKGNVRAGIGVALVSLAAVEADLALGRLVLVPHPLTPIVRPLSLVHRGEARLPPAAAALRELLLAAVPRAEHAKKEKKKSAAATKPPRRDGPRKRG
jgi:DNA-binding transcriptional LysR family regulator